MEIERDESRNYLLQLCEDGIVSWEEMARNCLMAMKIDDCAWMIQVYDYDDIYGEDEDEYIDEYGDLYTMADWSRDGRLLLELGQKIAPEVYYQLLESVPPTTNGKYFQPGEVFAHRGGVELYDTFELTEYTEDGRPIYTYIGLHPEK